MKQICTSTLQMPTGSQRNETVPSSPVATNARTPNNRKTWTPHRAQTNTRTNRGGGQEIQQSGPHPQEDGHPKKRGCAIKTKTGNGAE